MAPQSEPAAGGDDETVLEYVVKERLKKEDIIDLLTSLGGQRQGSRDELASRILAIKGLKAKDVLGKLPTDDLKLIVRRFDIPEPPKSTSALGFLDSVLSDEKSTLVKRIDYFASKQRPSRATTAEPRGPEPSGAPPGAPTRPAEATVIQPPSAAVPPPAPEFHRPLSSPAPALVSVSDQGQFDALCKFLESYTFTKRWNEEALYEAELGGAIAGHFPGQKVVHQMAVAGTRADIVACGAVIEIKYPKTRQPLQTLTGQVEGYQKLFGNKVVVVLCSGGMADTQALSESAASLTDRGARAFIK
jgi:hypothetical protein